MKVFKLRAFHCQSCDRKLELLQWDTDPAPTCPEHGLMLEGALTLAASRNRGVIDDQIEGGPRVFETMGHEGVYIESKSQWRREVEKRNLVNVVKHDSAYYAKQRKLHDEKLRDERASSSR